MMDYLAKYDTLEVEGVCIGEALRSHAEAIGSVVTDIQENAGNPDQIRMSLAQVWTDNHGQIIFKVPIWGDNIKHKITYASCYSFVVFFQNKNNSN